MNLAAAPPTSACQLGAEGSHGPDRISRSVYNLAGEVTQLQVAVGTAAQANEASFTYTLNGQRASVTDGEGNRAELRYDGHGRQNRWVFPSPTTAGAVNEGDYEAYGYDAGGNRTSLRNRAGETIAISYDALNRMTLRDRPGSEPDVSYGHDNLGRMTSAAQPGHALSFAFDGFGRTISESGPLGTMNHSYDIGGRRTLMNGPGGYALTFTHLVTGEIVTIGDGGGSPIGTYAYDPIGRRSGISRPNGTSTSYGYDGASRLSTLSHDLGGTSHDLSLGFSYNPAGQIVETTRSNDVYAFTALTNQSRTDSVNGLNQITQSGAATVTHDARGNTTSDGTRSFAYDSENRMTSGPGTTLSYDPLGRLYEASSGGTVRRFLHDGQNLIGEYDPATGWTAHHVSGPQVNDVLATYAHPSIARTFYYSDERGSVIAHADNAATTTQVNRYDEYGVPALTNAGRFQYTGQAWLPEIQLHYYRARMYDPRNGRFMQIDPVGYEDQYNLYPYVANDPVNLADPSGERGCGSRIEGVNECSGDSYFAYEERAAGAATEQPPRSSTRVGPSLVPGRNARMAPGGLRGQRIADPSSHIRIHVRRSPAQLRERLGREPRISAASSFSSEAVANRALARAVRRDQDGINAWIASGSPFPYTVRYESPTPLGIVWYRGASRPQESGNAVFILRPIERTVWLRQPYDYFAETGRLE